MATPDTSSQDKQTVGTSNQGPADASPCTTCSYPQAQDPLPSSQPGYFPPHIDFNRLYSETERQVAGQAQETYNIGPTHPAGAQHVLNHSDWGQVPGPSNIQFGLAPEPPDWSNSLPSGAPGPVAWLWDGNDAVQDPFLNVDVNDVDVSMDLGGDVNWFSWVEATEGLDRSPNRAGYHS